MLVQKEFINKIKEFGLNTYESKLWAALLSRGISTAGELSDIANVPRSRSYDVLESLEKKGFIVMKIGKPIKYIAVPPTEVVERVKKRIQIDANTNIELLEKVQNSEVLQELTLLHTQGVDIVGASDFSGSLRGRNATYNHMEMLFKNATHSINILTTETGLIRKFDALYPALEKAKKNGVKIRIAAPISKKNSYVLKDLAKVGEVKDASFDGRLAVIDNKDVVFMLSDDKQVHPTYDIGIWVNTPIFASTLGILFDREWKNMNVAKVSK